MDQDTYDSRYIEGIDCFNRGAYFQAHEVWESVWMEEGGTAKDFYKGLIQVAVCLHHFGNGNTRRGRGSCACRAAAICRIMGRGTGEST